MRILYRGAEANLYLKGDRLIKERIKKKYRVRYLDEKLRKSRTKRESKLLDSARRAGVYVPLLYKVGENKLEMEFIDGVSIKEFLDNLDKSDSKNIKEISKMIGESVLKLHNANIIHNDLTTSNMILRNKKLYMIDFGLGINSTRIEDKATDLVVLKKSLKAAHSDKFDDIWNKILKAYSECKYYGEILKRIDEIEKRARYA